MIGDVREDEPELAGDLQGAPLAAKGRALQDTIPIEK